MAIGHSARVDLDLRIGGFSLSLWAVGPDSITFRELAAILPGDADLVVTIDGRPHHHTPITLPHGATAARCDAPIVLRTPAAA